VSSADLKALRLALDEAAARDVQPEAIEQVLKLHGLTPADVDALVPIPESVSRAICVELRVCSSIWPPLPLTSPLDL
jgi:hypothetical protein